MPAESLDGNNTLGESGEGESALADFGENECGRLEGLGGGVETDGEERGLGLFQETFSVIFDFENMKLRGPEYSQQCRTRSGRGTRSRYP